MQNQNQPNTVPAHPLAELLDFGKPDERNIMLDLETLGTTAGSVILTVGAVEFDNDGARERLYRRISLKDSLLYGFTVDADTLKWWMGQKEAVRNEAFGAHLKESDTVTTALDWIQNFFLAAGKKVVLWGNGASFDPVLLEAYFRKFGLSLPFDYRNVRCYRTVSAMFPSVPKRVRIHAHDALADAEAQVQRLMDIRAFVKAECGKAAKPKTPFMEMLNYIFEPKAETAASRSLFASPEAFAPRSANLSNINHPPQ